MMKPTATLLAITNTSGMTSSCGSTSHATTAQPASWIAIAALAQRGDGMTTAVPITISESKCENSGLTPSTPHSRESLAMATDSALVMRWNAPGVSRDRRQIRYTAEHSTNTARSQPTASPCGPGATVSAWYTANPLNTIAQASVAGCSPSVP